MPFERNPDEIGSLWLRTGAKGDYMTGEIGGVKVICFPVTSTNPKAPSWRVLKSKPREDAAPERPMHNANAPELSDEDIPF